jgi:hypothetical protein
MVTQKYATVSAKNLPFPSFPKACPESIEGRGLKPTEKIPPLKKGDKRGFEFASYS